MKQKKRNMKPILAGVAAGIGTIVLATVLVLVFVLSYGAMERQDYYYDLGGGPVKSDAMYNGVTSGFGENFSDAAEAPDYGDSSESESGQNLADGRKLIRTANVRAETKDYDGYVAWLDDRLDGLGGYMENSECSVRTGSYSDYRTLLADIRVPAPDLDGFLNDIEARGNVSYRSENVDDVTTQYTDIDAHLDSMRVEQQRLNELLAMAGTVDEILSIEDRLSYVRYEIESYERQLRSYDSQIEYSTVHLEVREVETYTEPGAVGFFQRCGDGIRENAAATWRFLQDAGVFLFAHVPAFVLLAAVCFVIRKLARYLVRRHRIRNIMVDTPDTASARHEEMGPVPPEGKEQ